MYPLSHSYGRGDKTKREVMYPSQQNSTDQTANFFWLLAIISIGLIALWYCEKMIIVKTVFFIRHAEICFVQWIVLGIDYIAGLFHLPLLNDSRLALWQQVITHPNIKAISFADLSQQSDDVGTWFRYPVMAGLIAGSLYLFTNHRLARFHRIFNMNSLKKAEVENWPSITPVLTLDLLKQDLESGEWAMAQTPIDFCHKNKLLTVAEEHGKKIWLINRAEAEKAFVMQMGPLWKGLENLPIHLKALAVIFISRALRDEKTANLLLDQIAASAHGGQLNFSGVSELVEKYRKHSIFKWLEKRHAYVGTLMATLLELARSNGVLASAEFLWLKPVDRRMFYMLNSVGRRVACVEASGLFAHWKAEQKLKRLLRAPMVEQAVVALEEAITNSLYTEDEESWRTSNAA